jgi:predicted secreted protein
LPDINDDARGGKVIFVSHCVLNQNAKVRGIARYPGVIKPVLDLLVAGDAGIYQMPCPEMLYLGASRWGHVRDQYDSPMFRRHVQGLAEQVLDQAEDYRHNGYRVLGFIMIDGSPVCGLKRTPQPTAANGPWGGMVRYVPESHVVDESGVYCRILRDAAGRRGLGDIPFVSTPEGPDSGSFEAALASIRALL